MAPFGCVILLYAAWRMTNSFGLNEVWFYPPHMQAGLSLDTVLWNAREIFQWWLGDRFWGSLLAGWESFSTLAPGVRRMLFAGNIGAASLTVWLLARLQKAEAGLEHAGASAGRAWMFALAWTGATLLICLLSYVESRLLVLPAIGLCLALGLAFAAKARAGWLAGGAIMIVLFMTATQGTSESYRQAGLLNNRVYEHLSRTYPEWKDREVLLFDTAALRQRLTGGLINPTGSDPATWGEFNNALTVRGFVLRGMLYLVTREDPPRITIVHDVECGAYRKDQTLYWHERFTPDRPRSNRMDQVFVVDVFDVGTGKNEQVR
jgi:hypothetical protein